MTRHIGFTGTRHGMTQKQASRVDRIFATRQGWLHHGDCKGADAEAHAIARRHKMKIAVHPPINQELRAFCQGDETHAAKDYLARDRDIVDATIGLIAAPASRAEEQRSGTWATIRYAKRIGKPCVIVWPNGTTETWR